MGLIKDFMKPHGLGLRDPKTYNVINCPECDARGTVVCSYCEGTKIYCSTKCYKCDGKGYITCPKCNGEGWHTEPIK